MTFRADVLILFSMGQGTEIEPEGQIYTLDLLERLHKGLRDFGQTKDELYWRIDALLREFAIRTYMRLDSLPRTKLNSGIVTARAICGW